MLQMCTLSAEVRLYAVSVCKDLLNPSQVETQNFPTSSLSKLVCAAYKPFVSKR